MRRWIGIGAQCQKVRLLSAHSIPVGRSRLISDSLVLLETA